MYSVLSEALKYRLILELKGYWATHPKYKDSLVPNIQGKYAFEERPQQAIILKNTSANPIQFSADHFQGTVISYCTLMKFFGKNGTSIEWIKEDQRAIQRNSGTFPSSPGVYYIEVRKETVDFRGQPAPYLVFYVDTLLEVIDERPTKTSPTTYTLSHGAFHPGSIRLYEMPGNIDLYEGVNYSADPLTGIITLVRPLPAKCSLSADYRYVGPTSGPFNIEENGSNSSAIPGVVLAFGRRAYEGDVMVVVVSDRRQESCQEFGGKWEMSVDIDIMARDVNAQGEISDATLMFVYTILRDRLSFEGIEITAVSSGGEAEEIYDETGDDYTFTSSLSLTISTDWAIHVPLGRGITRVLPNTVEESIVTAGLSDDQLYSHGAPTGIHLAQSLGLVAIRDPYFRDRTKSFEMIR